MVHRLLIQIVRGKVPVVLGGYAHLADVLDDCRCITENMYFRFCVGHGSSLRHLLVQELGFGHGRSPGPTGDRETSAVGGNRVLSRLLVQIVSREVPIVLRRSSRFADELDNHAGITQRFHFRFFVVHCIVLLSSRWSNTRLARLIELWMTYLAAISSQARRSAVRRRNLEYIDQAARIQVA